MNLQIEASERVQIAIIGAGITGLSAAHRALESARLKDEPQPDVRVFEASSRVGGLIRTERRDGVLMEEGPDGIVAHKPAGLDLVRRLGLEDELVAPRPAPYVFELVHGGRLLPLPPGFLMLAPTRVAPVLGSRLFSLRGKLRLIAERFLPGQADPCNEESLRDFVVRRFGTELYERVAEPVIGGLFAADAGKLSAEATLPRFTALERSQGSVTRGILQATKARKSKSPPQLSLASGMERLIQALAASLPEGIVQKSVPVADLSRARDGWVLRTASGLVQADTVMIATPPHAAAPMLRSELPALAAELDELRFASCASVHLVYARSAWPERLPSHGFFVPRSEPTGILACSYSSQKFEGRSDVDRIAVRVFVGGALRPDALDDDDETMIEDVTRDLGNLVSIRELPVMSRVFRHPRAMPQLNLGFPAWRAGVEQQLAQLPGLVLAGSALGSYGIPDCVRSGEAAADSLLSLLARGTRGEVSPVDLEDRAVLSQPRSVD